MFNNLTNPYIIAEISGNHNGSLDRAKELINLAKVNGADCVKIQTYTPDTMTINCNLPDFLVKEGLWSGRTLYELYSEAYTPFEWHEELFNLAKQLHLSGKIEKSQKLYLKLIRNHKNNDRLFFLLGTSYLQLKKYNKAIDYLNIAINFNSKFADRFTLELI